MNYRHLILYVFTLFVLSSCDSNYNKTIVWLDKIEKNESIETIKKTQPHFIEVDWENPIIIDNETRYEIIKIKGNSDPLGMQHFLVFIDGRYYGRNSKK